MTGEAGAGGGTATYKRYPVSRDASVVRRAFALLVDLLFVPVAYMSVSIPLWSLAPELLKFPIGIAESQVISQESEAGGPAMQIVEVTYMSLNEVLGTCRFEVIETTREGDKEPVVTRSEAPLGPCPYLDRFDFGMVLKVFLVLFYAPLLESSRAHATVGKMAMAIQVRRLDGKEVSFVWAFLRNLAEALCLLTLGGGYLIALFTRRRQALHDLLTGTVVVER